MQQLRLKEVESNEDDESSSESEGADDDAAAEDGSNNGGEGDVRPRVETRGARKQAEREKRLPKSMPSASVCIAFEASLWPKDDREFTDGVQEVFLDGRSPRTRRQRCSSESRCHMRT